MLQITRRTITRTAGSAALLALTLTLLVGCKPAADPAPDPGRIAKEAQAGLKTPKLAINLPEKYNTPDGMTLNKKTGIMYLAVPNFNENCFKPGVMIKIMPDNTWSVLCAMPMHPDTNRRTNTHQSPLIYRARGSCI